MGKRANAHANIKEELARSKPLTRMKAVKPVQSSERDTDKAPQAAPSAASSSAAKRVRTLDERESALSRYYSEMAKHRVLDASEEIEIAKQVEASEVAYWKALLGYPPAVEHLVITLKRIIEEPPKELNQLRRLAHNARGGKILKKDQTRWENALDRAARQLREVDTDRAYVEEAYQTVQRLAGNEVLKRDLPAERIRRTSAFNRYLRNVRRACHVQQEVKNRFVAANLRLVVSMAQRYNRGRLSLEDLIQEGNFGLMRAVERFDHRRGYRFSTYASWWIRHALTRALADKGRLVRIPVHMLDTHQRVTRAERELAARTGRDPTLEEVAEETGLSTEKLADLKDCGPDVAPFSLDRPLDDDGGRTFLDFLEEDDPTPQDEQIDADTWNSAVRELLDTLSPMESQILRWRFGLDDEEELTLREIGDKFNLSRERIRQIQVQALDKIRNQLATLEPAV